MTLRRQSTADLWRQHSHARRASVELSAMEQNSPFRNKHANDCHWNRRDWLSDEFENLSFLTAEGSFGLPITASLLMISPAWLWRSDVRLQLSHVLADAQWRY